MTPKIERRFAYKALAASIAIIGINAPVVANEMDEDVRRLIVPESEIEFGAAHQSSDSFKFGDYTGMDQSGVHAVANVHVLRRGRDDARYFEIDGRDLGLDSRSLRIEAGEQGKFGLRLEYDQLPKLFSDSFETPFVNPGSTSLALPAGWVRGASTTAMTELESSMRPYDVESMRKSLGLSLTKLLPAGWDVSVNLKREKKEGDRFVAAILGNSGGNPRAVIVPEPVDYTTDKIEVLAHYTTPKLQLKFGYNASLFKNDNKSLSWQNPFSGTPWGGPADAFAVGQVGLPPDNQFHQISASGGYTISKDTRISGALSFGRMTQDERFLPYSVNPALTVHTPLPRNSLDGRIDTTHASLRLTSRLTPKLHLTANYRFDDRDNKTPQDQYIYIGGDSQNQLGVATNRARTNLPGSSTRHHASFDADYRLASRSKLKLGYEYDRVKKTFEPIDHEREHTVKAAIDHHFADAVSAGVSYQRAERRNSGYDGAAPVLASYSSEYLSTLDPALRWDDLPGLRKFFLANRDREKVRAFANVSATERLDLQFAVEHNMDRYPDSQFGLQKAGGWTAHVDANLQATDAVSGYLFASVEKYGTDQDSRSFGGGVNKATQSADPNRDWSMSATDRTYTFGIGLRVKPGGRYEWGGDISHSYSKGKIGFDYGSALPAATAPMPDLVTRLSRAELFGRYWVQTDLSINLKYIYERFHSKDWAYDGVMPSTIANVVGTNQTSPRYRVHVVGVSASYRFY